MDIIEDYVVEGYFPFDIHAFERAVKALENLNGEYLEDFLQLLWDQIDD